MGNTLTNHIPTDINIRGLSLGTGMSQFECLVSQNLSLEMLAYDRHELIQDHISLGRVIYCKKSIEGIFPSCEMFKLIILKDVIHELKDPDDILMNSMGNLSHRGLLLIIDPDPADKSAKTMQTLGALDQTQYKNNFKTPEEIDETLRHIPLKKIFFTRVGPGWIDNNDSFCRYILIYQKR